MPLERRSQSGPHVTPTARRDRSIAELGIPWAWTGPSRSIITRLGLTAVWTANLVLLVVTLVGFFASDPGYDWAIFVEAGSRLGEGRLYDWEGTYTWNYSPLLAYVFAALAPLGYVGWSLLHLGALVFVRDRWLAFVVLLSWPFWADVYNGNTMAFVLIAALGALQGSRAAGAAYFVMCLLMPRPLMLPVLLWLLWKQPEWRLWFAALVGVSALLVAMTGYGPAWIETLLGVSEAVAQSSRDIGPGNLLAGWWMLIGGVLAVALTLRGQLGWASVAASPYWLPQYLLMPLLELRRDRRTPLD